MELTQPQLHCPKCGLVIPDNTEFVAKDSEGRTVYEGKGSRLICETCAIAACPPRPKQQRLRRGEVAVEQMRIDAPTIRIG
jgi:hypothetical protein